MHYLLNREGGCFYLTAYIGGNRFTFKMKRTLIFLSSCYLLNVLHNVFLGKLPIRFFQYGFQVPQRNFSVLLSGLLHWLTFGVKNGQTPHSCSYLTWEVSLLSFCPLVSMVSGRRGAISLVFWVTARFRDQCWSSPVILTYQALKSFLSSQPWLPSIPLQCLILYSIVMFILFKNFSVFWVGGEWGVTDLNL